MTPLEQEILTVVNQIVPTIEKAFYEAFVMRHPGHANQKTHGNRFGAGQAKESLRRLKDDKGAREKYKETHRKKHKPSDSPWYGSDKKAKPKTASAPKQAISQKDLTPENRGTLSGLANSHKSTKDGERFLIGPASILSEGIGFKAYDKNEAKRWQDVIDKELVKEHPVIPGKTSRYTLTDLGKKLIK